MTVRTYNQTVTVAKEITTNVKNDYKLGKSTKWSYYLAKAILNPKKNIPKIGVNDAPNPQGTSISRTVSKADYLDIVKRYVKFVESDNKHRLPNYVSYGKHKIRPHLATLVFAKILVSYNKNGKLPNEVNINSKAFTKPTETGNAVYDYFYKKTGKKFKTLDDILEYVANNFKYEYYYDDHKSNKQVTDTKSGNCTDLLQWLTNMVEPLGYDWQCIHVQCRTSGTGHVFGKFRHKKNTDNQWIVRDIAAVASSGDIHNVWCRDGYVLAINPNWWTANRKR